MSNVISIEDFRNKKSFKEKSVADLLEEFSDTYRDDCVEALSDRELDKIALISYQQGLISSTDELDNIMKWAQVTLIKYKALCMAINGLVAFGWSESEQEALLHVVKK